MAETSGRRMIRTSLQEKNWPRSACSVGPSLFVVCEEARCRLLLFTSYFILRSSYGGERGAALDQFDSPWSVTSSQRKILVADSNNRRVQCFTIGSDDSFLYQFTLSTREKPFFLASNERYFAVSCENGRVFSYSLEGHIPMGNVNMNRLIRSRSTFVIGMNTQTSHLYLSDPIARRTSIHQLTITGDYLRRVTLNNFCYFRIHSLTFNPFTRELFICDASNSLIYAVKPDGGTEPNVRLVLQRSNSLDFPHSCSLTNEGQLLVVECSVTGEHRLKLF